MKRKRLRTVVCGSTFGQFYLEALQRRPEEFELAGLLARGSERSKQCAAAYGVNLYTAVNQLPADIDFACIVLRTGALGGSGTGLALQLLARGIHVMQEQPVHNQDMVRCLRTARRYGVVFQTGNFYLQLPVVRQFIACAKAVLAQQAALYIDAAFAAHTAYPLLTILLEALPSAHPWQIGTVYGEGGPFPVLTGMLGKVPVSFRVHNEVDSACREHYFPSLHRITMGSAGGSLSLTDTHGPVMWHPRLPVPDNFHALIELAGTYGAYLPASRTQMLGPASDVTYRDILMQHWPGAIARDLLLIRAMITGESPGAGRTQQALLCSLQWQEIQAAIGEPVLSPNAGPEPLPANLLQAAAAGIGGDNRSHNLAKSHSLGEPALAACMDYADSELNGIEAACVEVLVRKMTEAVGKAMLYTLQRSGVLTNREQGYSTAEILSAANTTPQHQYLIPRWLEFLCENNYLKRQGDNFCGAGAVTGETLQASWQAVRKLWDGKIGSPLAMDYLISNVEQLPQLLSGQQKAMFLLFPEGKMDYANALYRETITARYFNKAVAEAVIRIGMAKRLQSAAAEEAPLKILELGAGTGATTEVVWPRLKTFASVLKTEYLFTDVSSFLLAVARERFKDCPQMGFQIADIDQDLMQQGLPGENVDIIIATGVLNNAYDTNQTIDWLMQLLVPGGWLLITEPTREFPGILVSQVFMITRPEDDRKNTQTTFMSVKQWQDIFYKAGAAEVLILPGDDHPLTPLGQKLFAVRK